jgi:hypothetical protein
MNRFERAIQILDNAIGGPDATIGAHGAFWRGVTRDQFVATSVFTLQVITVGQGGDSNLVKALKGEAPFGSDLPAPPPDARFPRMPVGFDPIAAQDIAFIEQWIDEGCLEDPLPSPGGAPGEQAGAEAGNLSGTYTYRSFLDLPQPVDSFSKLQFAQLELQLTVQPDGTVTGALVFPAAAGAQPLIMDVSGKVSAWSPAHVNFTGKGRPGSAIADFHYEYDGGVLHHWDTGINQRLTIGGTVLRAEDHGSGATLARAGFTASFLAVKRDAVT